MPSDSRPAYLIYDAVLLLGDAAVGPTRFTQCFVNQRYRGSFPDHYVGRVAARDAGTLPERGFKILVPFEGEQAASKSAALDGCLQIWT